MNQLQDLWDQIAAREKENDKLRHLLDRAARELQETQERRVEDGGTPSAVIFTLLQEIQPHR